MTHSAHLQTLQALAATPPASFTTGEWQALMWAVDRLTPHTPLVSFVSFNDLKTLRDLHQQAYDEAEPKGRVGSVVSSPEFNAALHWAVSEISRLNSRNHTLEYQTNRLCELCDDLRRTLMETRESTPDALAQFETAVAADLREATEDRP